MILQYCSDLHLEFPENRRWLMETPIVPKAKILILAGDIVPFAELPAHDAFFDQLAANYEQIYWIPGNHEYYGSDAKKRSGSFREEIRSNLILTNNTVFEEGDSRLIFSTLWTNISPRHEWEIERSLNDFHTIDYGHRRLKTADVNQWHADSLAFITTEFARSSSRKTIVVTHHVPTLFHYPDIYKNSILNEAFAVELFPMIHDSPVSYWIFGHHHYNMADFQIGNTILTTNQLGYVANRENRGFSGDRTIQG